jgi:hypothetical protein
MASQLFSCPPLPSALGHLRGAAPGLRRRLESTPFDYVVTAMSSVSTARLLGASGNGASSGSAGGGGSVASEVVEAASGVQANVCWAVMVALNKKIGEGFEKTAG